MQGIVVSGWEGLDLRVSQAALPLSKAVYAQDTANVAGRPGVIGPRRGIKRAWSNGACEITGVASAMFRGGIRKRLVLDGCGSWDLQTVPYDPPDYGTQPGWLTYTHQFSVTLTGAGDLGPGYDTWLLPRSFRLQDYGKCIISFEDNEAATAIELTGDAYPYTVVLSLEFYIDNVWTEVWTCTARSYADPFDGNLLFQGVTQPFPTTGEVTQIRALMTVTKDSGNETSVLLTPTIRLVSGIELAVIED